MKVNDSYCLLIRIKNTIFTSDIKIGIHAGNKKPYIQMWNIWNFGLTDIDNQTYNYKY